MSVYHQKHSEDIFSSPNTSLSKILSFIPAKPHHILDIGCSSGYLGKKIKQIYKCHYVGIDIDKNDIEKAKKCLDEAYVFDIEKQLLSEIKFRHKFDVIIMADVLEHLDHPIKLLKEIHQIISKEGMIIISIPNINHLSTIISLFKQSWKYQETGIFDNTHKRFYDKESATNLITSAYYKIIDIDATTRQEILPFLLKPLWFYFNHPGFQTYQYIISAVAVK